MPPPSIMQEAFKNLRTIVNNTTKQFLFTWIHENALKRCIMHARPVVGDVSVNTEMIKV